MKILFMTRKYPPSVGGMERFAYDLQTELSKKLEVKLIKWGNPNAGKALVLVGVILPYFFVRASWTLTKGGIDVIHAQDGLMAPLGWLLSKLFRKPFVVVIHGLDITYKNPLFKLVIPRMVARADAVLCISQAAADEAIARGALPERVHVIPLGISDSYFGKADRQAVRALLNIPAEKKLLLTVGRLVKRKNVAGFIRDILPKVVTAQPETLYLVAGEGKERPNVEEAIVAAGMEKHVQLLGRVNDELLHALYNGADVFVMPNIIVPGDMEGFGLVSLEAALCELPLVATAVEGIKDAVTDGKNGILVTLGDNDSFADAVGKFLGDPKAALGFGKTARAYTLKNYRWETVADSYIEQYKKLAR